MIKRLVFCLLAPVMVGSCGESPQPVMIRFVPQFNEQAIACGSENSVVELTDLRFYVHDVQLIDSSGATVELHLTGDEQWQYNGIALLDLEDARGECLNGTKVTNASVRGRLPAGEYVGLQFTLGVPFERNHADPLLADAPLGDAAMHWHWRAGYKFMRAGIRTDDDGFWIHLGSTGCDGTVRNITGCKSPNRVTVRLEKFSAEDDVVVIDLAQLMAGIDLDDATPADCSSGPSESNCAGAFMALGLDFATGETLGTQRVFRSRISN